MIIIITITIILILIIIIRTKIIRVILQLKFTSWYFNSSNTKIN